MSKVLKVVGLDPSMSNFGMVKADLDLETGQLSNIVLRLQESKSDKSSKTVRKNSDDLNRARLLMGAMREFTAEADMIFVEIPVGSQTARAMASYGMCIGIISVLDHALVQVTPSEVKVAATGRKTASKQDMIVWATSLYPDANWLTRKVKGRVDYVNKNEHLADALATIFAGVKTDQFRQARSFLQ